MGVFLAGTAWAQEKKVEYKPTVYGFMQVEYRLDTSENLTVDNTFAGRRVWMGVRGSVSPLIDYNFLSAFTANAFLLTASVDLKFDPLFTVRAGQWQLQFTYEGWQPSSTLPFITRSNVIQHIAANYGTEGGPVLRDLGVALRGEWKGSAPGGYEVGIFNGNGGNKTDNNNSKDVIGRAWISPVKGVLLGVSGLSGTEGPLGTPAAKRDISAWGLDIGVEYGPLRGRAEYVAAKYDGHTGVAEERPRGWYAWVGYKVLPSLELLARYDWLNVNRNLSGQKIDTVTLGATYTFKKGTHLMVNYIFRDPDSTLNLAGLRNSEQVPAGLGMTTGTGFTAGQIKDAFIAQLQVSF
jgi:phosphate-selective porin